MAHFHFVISQNSKWGHAGFYIDCHRMTVPENILLQKALFLACADGIHKPRIAWTKAGFGEVNILRAVIITTAWDPCRY